MPYRPLVFVLGVTLGDYLLWDWSLNGNHDVLALVSGLTLPPLALACLWLLAVAMARLLNVGRRRVSPQRIPHEPGAAGPSAAIDADAPDAVTREAADTGERRTGASRRIAA